MMTNEEALSLARFTMNDLGQWIADQQAMPDDGWIAVRDRGLSALNVLDTALETAERKIEGLEYEMAHQDPRRRFWREEVERERDEASGTAIRFHDAYLRVRGERERADIAAVKAEHDLATAREALEQVADGPCQIYTYPGPTRDEEDNLVWARNCLDDLDRGERRGPCDRCRAYAALRSLGEKTDA